MFCSARQPNLGKGQLESICRKQIGVAQMLGFIFDNIENSSGKGENSDEPFPKQALYFTCLPYKSFENTVG